MSGSDRGEEDTLLGPVGYLLAVLLCCLIVGGLSYQSALENERRNEAPAAYSKAGQDDARHACVGLVDVAAFECVYEKVKSSQEQARGEQDLTAQQQSAFAARASAILTLLTVIVTAIGVRFVWDTLRETRKAVGATADATVAMVKQIELAEQSQRAWITVDAKPINMSPTETEREFVFDAIFKNIGQTATEIHFAYEVFYPAIYAGIQDPAVARVVPKHGIAILPGEEIPIRSIVNFRKERMFANTYILVTVIYNTMGKRRVGSYVFHIVKNDPGVIFGASLIGLDELANKDQIRSIKMHAYTLVI